MHTHRQQLLVAAALLAATALGACDRSRDPASAGAPAAAASAAVSDTDVTQLVKAALQQSDALKGADIAVATTNGEVRLTGVLDSQAQIDDALRVARAAEGSRTVHDGLTLRK